MVQVLYLLEVFILAHYGPPSTDTPATETTLVRWHKNSWIYLTSTYYYWWLLRPSITIRFDSKFQIIAQLFHSVWFEMKKKHYSHSTIGYKFMFSRNAGSMGRFNIEMSKRTELHRLRRYVDPQHLGDWDFAAADPRLSNSLPSLSEMWTYCTVGSDGYQRHFCLDRGATAQCELVICSKNRVPGPGSKIQYPVPNLGNWYPFFH